MAESARLGSAVVFVRDLDTSVSFYAEVLGLRVVDRSPTAALLAGAAGSQLILRAMGNNAAHALGTIGVQYVVWSTASRDALDRCEHALRARSAHRETRHSAAVTAVTGRDPDDIVVMITYPGPEQEPLRELPVAIYAW